MKQICVLGDGAWGTAIASMLASKGTRVVLWCNDEQVARSIKSTRINERYLPGIQLSPSLYPTTNLDEAMCESEYVFEAVPVLYLRSVLERSKHCFTHGQVWVLLSKGIEQETLMLPSQILQDLFGGGVHTAVVSGPSFAHDLARKQLTAVTLATDGSSESLRTQELLSFDYFRPYLCSDMIGVQVGGAVKNLIALAVGILEGAGCTDNTKAFLLSRGLQEMAHLAHTLGGNRETVQGLSGLGDLVLTAMGTRSKNLAVGRRLGKGESLQTIKADTPTLPEGINTVQAVYQLMQKHALHLPIFAATHEIIFKGARPTALLAALMAPSDGHCL